MQTRLFSLAALTAAALQACQPYVPSTPSPLQASGIPSATDAPASTATSTPSPTPDPVSGLREGVARVVGVQPYDAELLTTEYAKSPEVEQELLTSVPFEERAEFLAGYLNGPSAIGLVREFALDPGMCERHSYMAIDPTTLEGSSWYDVWGPPPDSFWEHLPPEWVVHLDNPLVFDCDNQTATLQALDSFESEAQQRLVHDEDAAEAILAAMLDDLFRGMLGQETDPVIEFETFWPTEVVISRADTGQVSDTSYYPIDIRDQDIQDIVDDLYLNVFGADHSFNFRIHSVNALMLSSDPSVPLVAQAGGMLSVPTLINLLAHQLIARFPLGSAQEPEAATIRMTLATIVEREMVRRFLQENYPDGLPRYMLDPTSCDYCFDPDGRHISRNLPDLSSPSEAPNRVYRSSELGLAMFDLRNCTIDLGLPLSDFFDHMSSVQSADGVYSELAACDLALAASPDAAQRPTPSRPQTATPSALEPGTNMLAIPSFEQNPTAADPWWYLDTRGTDASGQWTTSSARSGSHSLVFTPSLPGIAGWPGWFTASEIPLDPGITYLLSAWAMTPNSGQAWISVEFLDVQGLSLGGMSSGCTDLPSQEDWGNLSLTFSAMDFEGATQVQLGLESCLTGAEGNFPTIYYDDVYFGVVPP